MRVLFYRDCRALNRIQIAKATAEGTVVSDPYTVSREPCDYWRKHGNMTNNLTSKYRIFFNPLLVVMYTVWGNFKGTSFQLSPAKGTLMRPLVELHYYFPCPGYRIRAGGDELEPRLLRPTQGRRRY